MPEELLYSECGRRVESKINSIMINGDASPKSIELEISFAKFAINPFTFNFPKRREIHAGNANE